MTIHHLKIWPEFYKELVAGNKPFEARKDDRPLGFRVGDTLVLEEYDPCEKRYTGRVVNRLVSYVLRGDQIYASEAFFCGVAPGYCVMGLKEITP